MSCYLEVLCTVPSIPRVSYYQLLFYQKKASRVLGYYLALANPMVPREQVTLSSWNLLALFCSCFILKAFFCLWSVLLAF